MKPHNPESFSDEMVGTKDGWRLLNVDELHDTPSDTQHSYRHNLPHWHETGRQDVRQVNTLTFRTKKPLPVVDPLDQLKEFLS